MRIFSVKYINNDQIDNANIQAKAASEALALFKIKQPKARVIQVTLVREDKPKDLKDFFDNYYVK